jgi:hypothetical protein
MERKFTKKQIDAVRKLWDATDPFVDSVPPTIKERAALVRARKRMIKVFPWEHDIFLPDRKAWEHEMSLLEQQA